MIRPGWHNQHVLLIIVFLCIFVIMPLSCKKTGQAILVSIAVTPDSPSIAAGLTQQFTATGTYSDNSSQDLTSGAVWSSSSESAATISNATGTQGLATLVSVGTTTITAMSENVSGTTSLTIIAPPYEFNTEVFPSRYLSIPAGQTDGFPQDAFPVQVVDTANWDETTLERLPTPIRSAGVEDAPFVSPDGNTLYFTFLGDIQYIVSNILPAVDDPATGIYRSAFNGSDWSEPTKIGLVPNGAKALTGGGSIKNDGTFWFNLAGDQTGWSVHTYVAYLWNGKLSIGYDPGPPINQLGISAGEPEISSDGTKLYINSSQLGGYGSDDIFSFDKIGGLWQGPTNVGPSINTANQQNRPFITADGQHLYFDSFDGASGTGISIFRSDWTGTEWGAPIEILRNNLGEPALTEDGQWLYFVHYYYDNNLSAKEADIFRVRHK